MPGYAVRETDHAVGGHVYRLRVLSDTQQFADPDGHSARIGISSAQWSLFGQVWPAGRLLAQAHRADFLFGDVDVHHHGTALSTRVQGRGDELEPPRRGG